jgi:hypothetical protein
LSGPSVLKVLLNAFLVRTFSDFLPGCKKEKKMKRILFITLFLVLLVGCSPTDQESVPEPSNTALPPTQTYTPSPPTSTPTSTSTPTQVPTPTEIPQSYSIGVGEDSWQNYVNHRYRFSLLLPPNWAVIDLSARDFEDMLSVTLAQYPQLGTQYTPDFFKSLATSGVRLMSIEVDKDFTPLGPITNLTLVVLDLTYDITLDEYIELSVNELKNLLGEDLEINQEMIEFGGMPAGKLSYVLEFTDMSGQLQALAYQQFLMLKGSTQYVLTFTTTLERAADLADTFDLVSNSFESAFLYAASDGTSPFCDSWENACGLQTALALALPGDEIWVKAGIYTPAADMSSPEYSFWLRDGVAIYGGFAGTETSRDQRDWENNITVLSGDLGRDDTTDPDGVVTDPKNIVGQNAFHVVNGSGVNTTAILDGFVITAGYASETPPNINGYGGGMIVQSGSPTLNNLIFSGNTAGKGAAYYGGGGMYISFASNPVLTHVSFVANTAGSAGGMFNDRGSNPELNDVVFSGNKAIDASCLGNYGGSNPVLNSVIFDSNISSNKGCMINEKESNPILNGVTFSNNSAKYGAGMYNYQSSPTLTDVVFTNNAAGQVGGAMENEDHSNPILTNVLFEGNSAYHEGGGMFNIMGSNPILTNVAFNNNSVTGDGGGGGMNNYNSSPILTNVTFSGNHAVVGGGIGNWQSNLILLNVTFSKNTADQYGAAMYSQESRPKITNTIIWGNTPGNSQIMNDRGVSNITYSIIEGGHAGTGNIDVNPRLGTLVDNGGLTSAYSLGTGSPAIDAGSPSECPTFDQFDLPRPEDGDGDGSAVCDIGAFEYRISD